MRIHILGPQRRKPQSGDRRTTKKHGLQIRVRVVIDGCHVVSSGRPVFEWRKPEHLEKRDHHHLTPEERAKYFPPEREAGYMQQRGAA